MKEQTPLDPRKFGRAPVELTVAEAEQVSGGINPQPLPPGMVSEGIRLSDHWNR